MFKTFDYVCPICGAEKKDEVVESDDEVIYCICDNKMDKVFPIPHFQFGTTYFAGMTPRRVEVQFLDEDKRVLKEENVTHKVKLDGGV